MPQDLLRAFAELIQSKLTSHITGEPEEQLRDPFSEYLRKSGEKMGVAVEMIGEVRIEDGSKPDFAVSVNRLLCGYVELKALGSGADTSKFSGRNKLQWKRFSKLPNILYSDGREIALYRFGELIRIVRFEHDPLSRGREAVSSQNASMADALIRDFLQWEPIVPNSSRQLAEVLAPLCRMLRDDVLSALRANATEVVAAANDWRRYLSPGADDKRIADDYAQTVTFTLLLARSDGADTLFLDDAIKSLTHVNSLLSRALQMLTDPQVQKHLGATLSLIQRVIARVPTGTMSGGRRDPWLHFYEDFLAEYDANLRRDAGAYYTPVEVVQAQVRLVDDLLRNKLKKKNGFASAGVNVLDPAVGTGTYLLGIIEHALEQVSLREGAGAVPARADGLANTLFGFEIMVGPYSVASLRLTRMLHQYGGETPADGVQIMLNNTLESPNELIPELPLLYKPIGLEHKRAKRVKDAVPVLVCIGNPPYDRHAAAAEDNQTTTGSWVRWGESRNGRDAILRDFIDPVRAAGKGGSLKNLYNLYVYFWRWALWKTYEHELAPGQGVITYITAASFIDGDAFLGMRRHMRRLCDEIWIIDLGGEGRGTRRSDNVFAIQTPVAITITVRYEVPQDDIPAKVHYARIEGSRAEKLQALDSLTSLDHIQFSPCSNGWDDPFRPAGTGDYFTWPLLTELMPWHISGSQIKRKWPIGPCHEVLEKRWQSLLKSDDRGPLFKETRDRKITSRIRSLASGVRLTPIRDTPENEPIPPIQPYGYRAFDRQYLIADNRLADNIRPSLWHVHSDSQIYFVGLSTQPLDAGPALSMSPDVPDLHYFRGSYGAKDVAPLYRDAAATIPNLHPQLLNELAQAYGKKPSAKDVAAYLYAVLAHPAFTDCFQIELENRELRIPLTTNADLFDEAVLIGNELLALHSFGQRFSEAYSRPATITRCLKAVRPSPLPENYQYDESRRAIIIDDGEFGPVSKEVWEFELSGLKVVQNWLDQRMQMPNGKKSSPLDAIVPKRWTGEFTSEFLELLNLLTRTLEIYPEQSRLLGEILSGGLVPETSLGKVPNQWFTSPRANEFQINMGLDTSADT